jgi:hypothetical protein
MKKYFLIIPVIILVAFAACTETTELSEKQNEIIGAYQFTGNNNGMAIFSENNFLIVSNLETESATVDSLNTGMNLPKQIVIEAGTWSLQDSIFTNTYSYHSNPAKIGTYTRFKITTVGNKRDTYILGKNDEVIGIVTAIKLD